MLARLMVDVAHHETLQGKLAFKGGTCLHKLWMPEPWRYSEDLDYSVVGDVEPDAIRVALKEIGSSAGFTALEWGISKFGIAHAKLKGSLLDDSDLLLKVDVQLTPGKPPPLLQRSGPLSCQTAESRSGAQSGCRLLQ
ncbi:MAG: nucleotidyl transferase AbiEii/AbiGii toxin family protein [Acidimicrobiaceae bacterium]|nr:nucleotidyl transferase AbiEii/AbiGii toxin family protein [Acidimicrobiaceae bacterium]MCY4294883.1 nucleotidyl transferase AbiEii/AbiGii toxin family protein [Acidimicrobiaceae bacterium]